MLKLKRNIVVLLLQLLFLTVYAFVGGILFCLLEGEYAKETHQNTKSDIMSCLTKTKNTLPTKQIYDRCVQGHLRKQEWDIHSGTIFAFASITTIGYGALSLTTSESRLFYIAYCLIGMPLGLLVLANLGKFLEEGIAHLVESFKKQKKNPHLKAFEKKLSRVAPAAMHGRAQSSDGKDEPFEITGLWLLLLFVLYITVGVLGMTLLKQFNIVHSMYANFLSITAVDASALLSTGGFLSAIIVAYITGGLALATIAIGVLGKYMRKLHFLGQKLKDTGKAIIHFGGKDVSVIEFVRAVGEKWGVDKESIEKIDLDNVVESNFGEKTTNNSDPVQLHEPPPDPSTYVVSPRPAHRTPPKTFETNRQLALRRHSSYSPGRPEMQMDPTKLHVAYQIEWNENSPYIVKEAWDKLRTNRNRRCSSSSRVKGKQRKGW